MQKDAVQQKSHGPGELLGQMTRETIYSITPKPQENSAAKENISLDLTTMYINAMFYSALANLYMQTTLPNTLEEVDAEHPRLKIAFNRSYADYTSARQWLDSNGTELIADSSAKSYYDEVVGMDENSIVNIDMFYSRQS